MRPSLIAKASFLALILGCLLVGSLDSVCSAQGRAASKEITLKANWLKEFIVGSRFPSESVAVVDGRTVRRFAVIGDAFFSRVLAANPKIRDSESLEFVQDQREVTDNPPNVIYFGPDATDAQLANLEKLQRVGVITIGEQPDFIRRGGAFRVEVSKGRLFYNAKTLEKSRVDIQPRLLELAEKESR